MAAVAEVFRIPGRLNGRRDAVQLFFLRVQSSSLPRSDAVSHVTVKRRALEF